MNTAEQLPIPDCLGVRGTGPEHPVAYVDLAQQYALEKEELLAAISAVLETGQWVSEHEVSKLEEELKGLHGVSDVVAVASGTDALVLGMRALGIGPGDEIITPPNSFVSSTAAIIAIGATPVFCDVLDNQLMNPVDVCRKITSRTRGIMPVHLSGRCCEMDDLQEIAAKHCLHIIEDAAQAFGAKWKEHFSGTMGDIGCFSAHPLKNLNAVGDAGFVYTKKVEIGARLRRLRNNGMSDRDTVVEWGQVSRMDSLQAVVLRQRLCKVSEVTQKRRENASLYYRELQDTPLKLVHCSPEQYSVFHTFVVKAPQRDELKEFLREQGIGTSIHYPVPIHLQPAAYSLGYKQGDFPEVESQSKQILSLPVHQYLKPSDISRVCRQIRRFYS